MNQGLILSGNAGSKLPKREWKNIAYNICVVFQKSNYQGHPEVYRVMGRALGERNDGQCFWASIDLPMIWDDPRWRWPQFAAKRLDTFLSHRCKCSSDGSAIARCRLHMKLISQWEKEDRARNAGKEVADNDVRFPSTGETPGPIPQYTHIAKDYPWIVREPKRKMMRCLMCDFEDRYEENISWRNQFILKHSHCGFGRKFWTEYDKNMIEQGLNPMAPTALTGADMDSAIETILATAAGGNQELFHSLMANFWGAEKPPETQMQILTALGRPLLSSGTK